MSDDYSLRCTACCIGTTATGGNIGGLISQYTIGCITPEGTLPIAKIARCINMGGPRADGSRRPACEKIHIEHCKPLPAMSKYGISMQQIITACKDRRGNLFTLEELKGQHTPTPDYNEPEEPTEII